MTLKECRALRPGDKVFWDDPDGSCSRTYVIHGLSFKGSMVQLWEAEGGILECFPHELRLSVGNERHKRGR